jgi:hypothetical protein
MGSALNAAKFASPASARRGLDRIWDKVARFRDGVADLGRGLPACGDRGDGIGELELANTDLLVGEVGGVLDVRLLGYVVFLRGDEGGDAEPLRFLKLRGDVGEDGISKLFRTE